MKNKITEKKDEKIIKRIKQITYVQVKNDS